MIDFLNDQMLFINKNNKFKVIKQISLNNDYEVLVYHNKRLREKEDTKYIIKNKLNNKEYLVHNTFYYDFDYYKCNDQNFIFNVKNVELLTERVESIVQLKLPTKKGEKLLNKTDYELFNEVTVGDWLFDSYVPNRILRLSRFNAYIDYELSIEYTMKCQILLDKDDPKNYTNKKIRYSEYDFESLAYDNCIVKIFTVNDMLTLIQNRKDEVKNEFDCYESLLKMQIKDAN